MLSSGSGGQPRGARGLVQADCDLESGTSGLRFRRAPLLALLLAGCSSLPASMNPVSWWHDLQGGKIAEERPPPPGADQPYPNLASVPPKPEAPDRAALANIATALVADRTNAQHAAAPIADPSLPSASPGLFGRGTVPPPAPPPPAGAAQASATMAAADAPPAPRAPSPPANPPQAVPAPAKAPLGTVQSAPLAAPGAAAPSATSAPLGAPAQNSPLAPSGAAAQNAPLAPPGSTAQPPAVAAAPPPALPTAPPPPPRLSGVGSASPPPPSAPAATVPAAAPPPAAPTTVAAASPATPPPTNAANTVSVTFVNGSAALTPTATDTLKQLASRRGTGMIAVTGYGDAASDSPDAQSAALVLGLSRAQAMATALTAAGVPASAVQVDAAAIGRGATARLVQ
jgi:outer membrane protein OmpA-like peptidoglycan-associated protein